MSNTQNAKKAQRSSARKQVFNLRTVRTMRSAVKMATVGKDAASKSAAQKAIDKACKRGIIKENTASRMKSRLNPSKTKATA